MAYSGDDPGESTAGKMRFAIILHLIVHSSAFALARALPFFP